MLYQLDLESGSEGDDDNDETAYSLLFLLIILLTPTFIIFI